MLIGCCWNGQGNMAAGAQIDHSRGTDAGGWGEDGLADANQSYILLRDKAALLAELPAYASPAVRAAIERANPFFRMHNLAENMGIATERLTTVRALLLLLLCKAHHSVIRRQGTCIIDR